MVKINFRLFNKNSFISKNTVFKHKSQTKNLVVVNLMDQATRTRVFKRKIVRRSTIEACDLPVLRVIHRDLPFTIN